MRKKTVKTLHHRFLIIISFLLPISITLFSQPITWTGATDNSWHKACNWDINTIPTCSHDVVIPTVATVYPNITGIAHSQTVEISSTSSDALTITSSGGGRLDVSFGGGSCSGIATDSAGCGLPDCTLINSNATANNDNGNAMAINSTGIFLAGGENDVGGAGSTQWRIEKRDPTTGALVAAFGTGGVVNIDPDPAQVSEIAWDAVLDATGLYIIGSSNPGGVAKWLIVKLNLTTGATIWSQTSTATGGMARNVAVDGSGVYIIGYEIIGNFRWRIEKRDLSTGTLIGAFGTSGIVSVDPTGGHDFGYCITINGSSIYVGGNDNTPGTNPQWRIEKRDATTGALLTGSGFGVSGVLTNNITNVNNDGNAIWAITNDGTYLYIAASGKSGSAGCFSVEKLNITTGAQLWTQSPTCGSSGIGGIVVDGIGVYAAGTLGQWRLDGFDLTTGAILCTTTSTRYANDIAKSGSNVYVFGTDFDLGVTDFQWRIETQCGCP